MRNFWPMNVRRNIGFHPGRAGGGWVGAASDISSSAGGGEVGVGVGEKLNYGHHESFLTFIRPTICAHYLQLPLYICTT